MQRISMSTVAAMNSIDTQKAGQRMVVALFRIAVGRAHIAIFAMMSQHLATVGGSVRVSACIADLLGIHCTVQVIMNEGSKHVGAGFTTVSEVVPDCLRPRTALSPTGGGAELDEVVDEATAGAGLADCPSGSFDYGPYFYGLYLWQFPPPRAAAFNHGIVRLRAYKHNSNRYKPLRSRKWTYAVVFCFTAS